MAFKTLLLASALAFGGTAIAQDTTTTAPPADPAAQTQPMTPPPADPAAPPPADPAAAPAPMGQAAPTSQPAPMPGAPMAPAPSGQMTTMAAPDGFQSKESAGGYMPANPPMAGMAQPGQQVQFVPAPPVAQAYPAPAPLQTYPICKKGQTDKCRQRGG